MNVREGQNLSAQAHELVISRIARIRRRPGDLVGPAGVVLAAGAAATAALAHWEAGANRCPAVSWLSFRRIIDVPFGICMIALESWQRTGPGGELHIGQSLLRWPIEHDGDCSTSRIEVGLARGPLRPPLRMRLDVDRWYPSSSRIALELIPCQRVRPTAAYFRSGHLLLDSLTQSLLQHLPAQHIDRVPAVPPTE
jgi:hypothetical protein